MDKNHPLNTIFMWLSSSRQQLPFGSPPSYMIVVALAFVDVVQVCAVVATIYPV